MRTPSRSTVVRGVGALTSTLAISLAVSSPSGASTPSGVSASGASTCWRQLCGVMFDDFDYRSSQDPRISQNGWKVRGSSGGPGVPGATWSADNVSFPISDGHRSLRLKATTNGTAAGTTQSEFARSSGESLEGTYFARIKFSDAPASGTDGDPIVQTFFAISNDPLADCDPSYAETDFSEYLPNGGWGDPRSLNSQTTWARVGAGCDASSGRVQQRSMQGWHDIMSTVSKGHVKYYVDGRLVGDDSGRFFPTRKMAIDFNLWFVDLTQHVGQGKSGWQQDVDYVLYAKDRVLTPGQVTTLVRHYRSHEKSYVNSLPGAVRSAIG